MLRSGRNKVESRKYLKCHIPHRCFFFFLNPPYTKYSAAWDFRSFPLSALYAMAARRTYKGGHDYGMGDDMGMDNDLELDTDMDMDVDEQMDNDISK